MDAGEEFILVDCRDQVLYDLGHIPGAQNITIPLYEDDPEMEIASVKLLLLPKNKLIITYWDWIDDDAATRAAVIMLNDKYEPFNPDNVLVLWKGYYGWIELGYPVEK